MVLSWLWISPAATNCGLVLPYGQTEVGFGPALNSRRRRRRRRQTQQVQQAVRREELTGTSYTQFFPTDDGE